MTQGTLHRDDVAAAGDETAGYEEDYLKYTYTVQLTGPTGVLIATWSDPVGEVYSGAWQWNATRKVR